MLLMGDEYGHSKGGNNNTYCHDGELNWFDWHAARSDLLRFLGGAAPRIPVSDPVGSVAGARAQPAPPRPP